MLTLTQASKASTNGGYVRYVGGETFSLTTGDAYRVTGIKAYSPTHWYVVVSNDKGQPSTVLPTNAVLACDEAGSHVECCNA